MSELSGPQDRLTEQRPMRSAIYRAHPHPQNRLTLMELLAEIRRDYDYLEAELTAVRRERDALADKCAKQEAENSQFRASVETLKRQLARLQCQRLPEERVPEPSRTGTSAHQPPPPALVVRNDQPSRPLKNRYDNIIPDSRALSRHSSRGNNGEEKLHSLSQTTPLSSSPSPRSSSQREQCSSRILRPSYKILSFQQLVDAVPLEHAQKAGDWLFVYNPAVRRTLEVKLVHSFLHDTHVCAVRFSPNGRQLATGTNKQVLIFDVRTGNYLCTLPHPSSLKNCFIRTIKFSSDSRLLVTGSEDTVVRVWDLAKRAIAREFRGHTNGVHSVDISNDMRYVVSGSSDSTMRIWDMTTDSSRVLKIEETDTSCFYSVSISADSTLVVASTHESVIRIYDIETGELATTLLGHGGSVFGNEFTPGGSVVSASEDKTAKLWDVSDALRAYAGKAGSASRAVPAVTTEPLTFVGHDELVVAATITRDERWVISGSRDRRIALWDSRTCDLQFVIQGFHNTVICLDSSPVGDMFASGSGDRTACIWSYSYI